MSTFHPEGREKTATIEEWLKVDRNTCGVEVKRFLRQRRKEDLLKMVKDTYPQVLEKADINRVINLNYDQIYLTNSMLSAHCDVFLRLFGIEVLEVHMVSVNYAMCKCKYDPVRYNVKKEEF